VTSALPVIAEWGGAPVGLSSRTGMVGESAAMDGGDLVASMGGLCLVIADPRLRDARPYAV